MQTPPRHFLTAPRPGAWPVRPAPTLDAWLEDAGLPQERLARIAARRTFVEIKQRFIDAVAHVAGSRGDWLRNQVRQTQEPVDLWLLRGAVFAALRGQAGDTFPVRLDLHRALDSVFPDSGELTPFMPLA